jgi:hypothetical protein
MSDPKKILTNSKSVGIIVERLVPVAAVSALVLVIIKLLLLMAPTRQESKLQYEIFLCGESSFIEESRSVSGCLGSHCQDGNAVIRSPLGCASTKKRYRTLKDCGKAAAMMSLGQMSGENQMSTCFMVDVGVSPSAETK